MVSWITVTWARLFKAAHLKLFLSFLGRQAVEVCPSPSTVNSASLQFLRGRLHTKQAESTTCCQPYRAHQELRVFVGEGGEAGQNKGNYDANDNSKQNWQVGGIWCHERQHHSVNPPSLVCKPIFRWTHWVPYGIGQGQSEVGRAHLDTLQHCVLLTGYSSATWPPFTEPLRPS